MLPVLKENALAVMGLSPRRGSPRTYWAVFAVFAALLLSGCGLVKYDLADAPAQKGEKVISDSRQTIGTSGREIHMIAITETKEVEQGKASAQEVFFQRAVLRGKAAGVQSLEVQLPLHGTTVFRRRVNGRWLSQFLKNPRPQPDQMKALAALTDDTVSVYPETLLQKGETWTVPPEKIRQMFGSATRPASGTMTCTLVRTEDFAGQKCAVISVKMDLHSREAIQGSVEVSTVRTLEGTIWRALAKRMDLKIELTGTLAAEGGTDVNGRRVTASGIAPMPMTITEVRSVAP